MNEKGFKEELRREEERFGKRMFDYGKQEGISLAQKEELEFIKRLPKEWLEYSFMKQRIVQLEKGRKK